MRNPRSLKAPRGSSFMAALGPLSLVLTSPLLSSSAFAQEEMNRELAPDTRTEAPAADPIAPETPEPPATDPPAAPDSASADSEPSAVAASDAEAPKEPPAKPTPPEPDSQPEASSGATSEPTASDKQLSVELDLVPASGYPAWQVRGIPDGSLAATMHGMQWPYLPAEGSDNTLKVGVSGYFWNDLSYASIESGLEDTYPNQKRVATQSRGLLRLSPTFSTPNGWFVQSQGEFVIHGDLLIQNQNLASTDDLYVRAGKWKLFDVTVGRFQGWEIANHYGMGLDLNTLERTGAAIEAQSAKPAPAYGLTYFWDRKDGRLGHYAAHLYPTDYLRFEMLAELGTGTEGIMRQTNFRPSGILDFGFLKVKGGFEYGTAVPQGEGELRRVYRNGFGGAVQFVLAPWLEGGVSFARGYEDLVTLQGIEDLANSNTVTGYGGFLNARPLESLVVGVGALDSHWENLSKTTEPGEHYGDPDTNDQLQTFVAVQYDLWDQLYFKLVASHAKFDFYESSSTPFTNEMWGLRFRTAVAF